MAVLPDPWREATIWSIESSHNSAFEVATLIPELDTYAYVDVRVGKAGRPSLILRIEGCNITLGPAFFQISHKSV